MSRKNPVQVLRTDLVQINFNNILFAGLPRSLLPSGPSVITVCVFLYSTIRATCAAHLIILDLLTLTLSGEEHNTRSSSLRSHLKFPFASSSSFHGQNIFLSALFSCTVNLLVFFVSLSLRRNFILLQDNGTTAVLYILIFTTFDNKLEDKIFWSDW